jgi:hypothetical protein
MPDARGALDGAELDGADLLDAVALRHVEVGALAPRQPVNLAAALGAGSRRGGGRLRIVVFRILVRVLGGPLLGGGFGLRLNVGVEVGHPGEVGNVGGFGGEVRSGRRSAVLERGGVVVAVLQHDHQTGLVLLVEEEGILGGNEGVEVGFGEHRCDPFGGRLKGRFSLAGWGGPSLLTL